MHLRPLLFALALTFCFVALPDLASAKIPFWDPIIPQTGSTVGDAATCPLGWPALITVINNIISLLITIAIVAVAPIMIAYAGFLFVVNPVNASGKEEAKTILWHTVIGIAIALSAYLIVGAIMAVLYKPTAFWTTWSDIVTKGSGDLCIKLASSLHQAGPPPDGGGGPPPSGDETAVRARFAAAGIGINNPPCPPGSDGHGCTNVGGMRPDTIDQVINLKNACGGCAVTITGGSEPGHAVGSQSHGNGYKVDIRSTGEGVSLTTWIQNHLTAGPARGGDCAGSSPTWNDSCGNQYVLEAGGGSCAAHWDIKVTSSCSL